MVWRLSLKSQVQTIKVRYGWIHHKITLTALVKYLTCYFAIHNFFVLFQVSPNGSNNPHISLQSMWDRSWSIFLLDQYNKHPPHCWKIVSVAAGHLWITFSVTHCTVIECKYRHTLYLCENILILCSHSYERSFPGHWHPLQSSMGHFNRHSCGVLWGFVNCSMTNSKERTMKEHS